MAEEKAEALTASEAELKQREDGPEGVGDDALKESARDEKKQQKAGLAVGKKSTAGDDVAKGTPAQQRTQDDNAVPTGPQLVDNMTVRDGAEAMVGHFATVDYSVSGVKQLVQDQLAPKGSALADQDFEPGVGSADYGVVLDTAGRDKDGYPETARFFLRDEHAAIVNVPWKALRRATAGGRR
jgi:hypothetical protein